MTELCSLLSSPPGSSKDGGILPRSLALIFNSVGEQLYRAMDLKPSLSSEVAWLDSRQVQQEETKKLALLHGGLREVSALLRPLGKDEGALHQPHVLPVS